MTAIQQKLTSLSLRRSARSPSRGAAAFIYLVASEKETVAIILYVDSDQLYMSAMKLLLEKNGFKVLLARTRDHMKQVLLGNMVDAVVVDQDFLRECPQVIPEVRTLSPTARTVLLGMRNSERPKDSAVEFCARLDGPEKLVQLLQSSAAPAMRKSAHQA